MCFSTVAVPQRCKSPSIRFGVFTSDLLDRDAFGEVSGLVYVAASADGDVVGEELEGDYFEDGEEEFVGRGDGYDVLD